MKTLVKLGSSASLLAMLLLPLTPTQAAVFVQCPGDEDGDAEWSTAGETQPANTKCMHLSGGDGFANMGDVGYQNENPLTGDLEDRGRLQYIFSFGNLTGVKPADAVDVGLRHAELSAPSIVLEEGDEFYLSLTNTGMVMRPDLFDPHTVHFHGFPNASSIFDGLPDVSISVNMGATLTYYYNIVEPGTYMYHCHVEAAEHMQMGMLGNLYVKPGQNECETNAAYNCPQGHSEGDQYAYNDGDGSTRYDDELALQISSIDPVFHDASLATQPLPFADMRDTYTLFNGRGYPTTVDGYKTAALDYDSSGTSIPGVTSFFEARPGPAQDELDGYVSQKTSAFKKVTKGERLLVRVSNLSITKFNTVTFMGLPVEVVGQGGRLLDDSYRTTSVNLGGGEAFDVIIDTADVPAGDYFVYVTELHELSNNTQSFGGPMTIIQVVD